MINAKGHWYYLLAITIMLLHLVACSPTHKKERKPQEQPNLFTALAASSTGIHFNNEIPESRFLNSMVYEYFYNGGGVAIGDIDNDNLPDIYFTANLKDNKLYKNKGDFKFEDITQKAKVKGSFGWTTGVTMADINADGWLDIYVCKSGKGKPKDRKNLLYINNQDGTFSEKAAAYNLDFEGYSTQASFFDFDKDGDLDLFLLNHNVNPINTNNPEQYKKENNPLVADRLYRNDGGKFVNISKEAGIIENTLGFGLGVAIGDLNQDQWPDIYVANDYIEQDYLYYNNGDGTFTEQLKNAMGHVSHFSMGTDIADFNNDGLLDLMTLDMVSEDNYGIKTSMSGMDTQAFYHATANGFHYQYMYNTLQLNHGNGHFSDIAKLAGVAATDWSWGPLFADFDNDGLKDIFISNGLKRDFRNNDFRKLKLKRLKEAQAKGEKMTNVIEELVAKTPSRATPNYFYKNNGNLSFTKTTKNWGISKPSFSNGAAYADLDQDGDLDLVINNIDQKATILKNNAGNNYLQVSFKGNPANPFGVGVHLKATTKSGTQILENYPSRGYQSAVAPILHLGLGQESIVDQLEITWPDGKRNLLKNIDANQKISIAYKDAQQHTKLQNNRAKPPFKDITLAAGITHKHQENHFNDFERESLLPHKMSELGPALAVADINKDGLEDFYIGGAKGYAGSLYLQNTGGTFSQTTAQHSWAQDKDFEDTDALFLDYDKDGDLDLYVVSGGNEWPLNSPMYQDRLYTNDGKGNFKKSKNILPHMPTSGGVVAAADYNQDGKLDVFIGGRQVPGKYPQPADSYLLENQGSHFKTVDASTIPGLKELGMVTDALWTDYNADGKTDLIITGEWMPITIYTNQGAARFKKLDQAALKANVGWWSSIAAADFDGDGDQDFIGGNLGANYKYKASKDEPFTIHAKDFDQNGSLDIVLGYHNQGDLYPLRGRECSANQMPFIKEKFPDYDSFGKANLVSVYGEQSLKDALQYAATNFYSCYIENNNGQFTFHPLPNEAQFSSVNAMQIQDVDQDGLKDLILAGNMYQSEVETPRNDAGIGLVLKNTKTGFKPLPYTKSGLFLNKDVKKISPIKLGTNKALGLLVANNQGNVQLIAVQQ